MLFLHLHNDCIFNVKPFYDNNNFVFNFFSLCLNGVAFLQIKKTECRGSFMVVSKVSGNHFGVDLLQNSCPAIRKLAISLYILH